MTRFPMLPALLCAAALFVSGAARGQQLVHPNMPPGFEQQDSVMLVPGSNPPVFAYVYKNKATGEERRVLATERGAIRRYLPPPQGNDDPNFHWIALPDTPCNQACLGPHGHMHQFPVPNPFPPEERTPYDPGTPIGKQGWNYGMGSPPDGAPPPDNQPDKTGQQPRAEQRNQAVTTPSGSDDPVRKKEPGAKESGNRKSPVNSGDVENSQKRVTGPSRDTGRATVQQHREPLGGAGKVGSNTPKLRVPAVNLRAPAPALRTSQIVVRLPER